jgi:uncharacterized membrane-anchored protein YhcB (DUF1043 family)
MFIEGSWLFILIAFVIGALIGFFVGSFRRTPARENPAETERLRQEFQQYREEVSDHFVKTADLVNNLTHSYRAVYEHLEGGAYQLVGEETLQKRLANVDAEPVMLEYIGGRAITREVPAAAEEVEPQEPAGSLAPPGGDKLPPREQNP